MNEKHTTTLSRANRLALAALLQDGYHYAHGALATGESVFDPGTVHQRLECFDGLHRIMGHVQEQYDKYIPDEAADSEPRDWFDMIKCAGEGLKWVLQVAQEEGIDARTSNLLEDMPEED